MGVRPRGGRRWWARLAFSPMNSGPIILKNQVEDVLDISGSGEVNTAALIGADGDGLES